MDKNILKKIIIEEIQDAEVAFVGDDCNLKLSVTSNRFEGMPIIQQHRMVLNLLKNNFESGELHALSLETHSKE
jgi:stress-induced morphogen